MPENRNISDHLANERTFLAWIRTSVGRWDLDLSLSNSHYLCSTGNCFLGKRDQG
jgi:hypothetical protein